MPDLAYIDKTLEVKLAGQDATGNGVNYVAADVNGNMLVKDYSNGPVTPGGVANASSLMGGQYNSSLPSLTTSQQSAIQLDSSGRIIIRNSEFPATVDTNYGTVGASTLRTASEIGNATGAADFNTGATGAQTLRVSANQGTSPWVSKDQSDGPVIPGTVASFSQLMGGQYNSTLPVATTGQQVAIQTDANGRVLVSSSPLPTTASKFSFGDILTSGTALNPVERTSYAEQTASAAMTLVSSSANDTSAGTGARTVQVTYLDNTMAGPFTTAFSMNGATVVTAGVSNMCYIEKIQVLTVGSTGSNAGTLTLKSGATTVGTVNAGDLQTFWAHHYVPTGKTTYISGFSINSTSTTTGSGGTFILKASTPTVANTPELQVSDFHRLYGQQSSTNTRTYLSPIQVAGPARIKTYVAPETTTSTTYRASFDYIDN